MGTFDVYVEGPADTSPTAARQLAGAMAARYGLPAGELLARMTKGRFRVKGNLDRETADTYARDLETIGARVTVASATTPTALSQPLPTARPAPSSSLPPATSSRPPPSSSLPPATEPKPAPGSPLPPAAISKPAPASVLPPATSSRPPPSSSLPPATEAKPAPGSPLPPATSSRPPPTSSLPPATSSRPPPTSSLPPATEARAQPASALSAGGVARHSGPIASGLSAAFTAEQPASSLGALDQDLLTLSALDGSDGPATPDASFAPPTPMLPASIGPAIVRTSGPVPRPTPVPQQTDRFAPPEAADEIVVELAADELAYRAQVQASNAASQRASASPAPRVSTPSLAPRTRPVVTAGATVLAEAPRWRFLAGVLLAVGLGFAPAHLIAASREEASFAAIDKQVIAVQTAADTPEAYAALDKFRAAQLERKQSARRNIALLGFGIWAGVAALIAFVWFRVLLREA